ncbi:MAG TPA: amidohydrolase family protein [Thermoanaerobaculia bacterium]|nr:amidohydrolase family protein [Thermoanaerobaculia bacterium]
MKRFLIAAMAAMALSVPVLGETDKPIGPLADHHTHLLSPNAAKLINDPPLPAIELPADLARLLRAREKGWNDKASLAGLYTEDSLVFDINEPRWVRGRDEVTTWMAGLFARPYRVTPIAYGVKGSAGHIAAYFTRGDGAAARHFGQVLFSLEKGADGVWQIAAESPTFPGPTVREPTTAEQLVAQFDEAGIQRGAVLSSAYWHGSPFMRKAGGDEYANVRAENDWTVQEVARAPSRLVAFCSFNPLKDYALKEIDRCSKLPQVKGLKLHFGNSEVDVRNAQHVEKVRRVFAAANERRLAIVAHLWVGHDKTYGREHAVIFLNQILPAAPDIPVQIAHFAGGGPGYTDEALVVYAEAIAAGDPRTKNLYFDFATVADDQRDDVLQTFAKRIRQIGLHRVLYGTDLAPPTARQSWLTFRTTVPLTDEEFRAIAGNIAPYLR